MKLFQKLLLAPAALGLFAPVVANANESNFRDVTSYSQDQVQVSLDTFKPLSNKNPLLAGGEGSSATQSDVFDVDTFSSTTTASFTSNFAVGVEEGVHGDPANRVEPVISNFDWEIATTTSFTGNDSLDVVMVAGASAGYTELDMTNNSKKVTVDSISYTTALGERVSTFFGFGDGVAGSSLYNTACIYGAQADTFSNCGVSAANIDEGFGTALGVSFDLGYGFTAALGYEGSGGSSNGTKGLATKESTDALGGQLAYTGDSFGVSVSWANIENHSDANVVTTGSGDGQTQSFGINAYYSPDLNNFPSISGGLETSHDDSIEGQDADNKSHYFIGIQWDDVIGDGTFGAAMGSKTPYAENADALNMYEVYYSYNYADGITITPLFYSKDNSGSTADETGVVIKSTFSF